MAECELHIVHWPNPFFAECTVCHARFSSFDSLLAQAEAQVQAAFKEHKMRNGKASKEKVSQYKNALTRGGQIRAGRCKTFFVLSSHFRYW